MNITYTYRCSRTDLEFRVKVEDAVTVKDEPYTPGGMLRVVRNGQGQAIAGPLVSEITSWVEA